MYGEVWLAFSTVWNGCSYVTLPRECGGGVGPSGLLSWVEADSEDTSSGAVGDCAITRFCLPVDTANSPSAAGGADLRVSASTGFISTGAARICVGCEDPEKTTGIPSGVGNRPVKVRAACPLNKAPADNGWKFDGFVGAGCGESEKEILFVVVWARASRLVKFTELEEGGLLGEADLDESSAFMRSCGLDISRPSTG